MADSYDMENAKVLADLVVDPETPEALRVKIIRKLLETIDRGNFFDTILNEKLSFGACPNCKHENHWVIPEDELNQMGWATHEKDDRVPRTTRVKDCSKWQQACKKKKITL
jgi:hypothetical protein